MSRPLAVRIELRDSLLREALSDVIARAGHRLAPPGASVVDLVIRAEPGPADAGPAVCVLALRPTRERPADPEPRAALERALGAGGLVVWPRPLDVRALLAALGASAAAEPDESELGSSAPFATAAEPWLLVDSARAVARPLNRAAAERQALGDVPWTSILPRVCAEQEGLSRVVARDGQWALAWWWSPSAGRRLLGWLAWPRIDGLEDLTALRALADLGRISSTFAHEVRNPLAALTSAIDLLGRDLPAAERSEVLTLARSRLASLRSLLDDTLRLVRSFRGAPQPVDLAEVVASALAIARSDPEFRSVALAPQLPEPCPEALSYAEPLRQALTNLLLNAAQAQQGTGRIEIDVAQRGSRVVLAVEDRGPGVPVEQRERVFEPFWTTKSTGTGLGLVYVRRVAEASAGRVHVVTPRGGVGARFEIELPAAASA